MRIIATIKDRLESNTQQRRRLGQDQVMPKTQQIRLEYLRMEAQIYHDMLGQLRNRRWSIFRNRKLSLVLAISTMSIYVLGIFYMFQEMDLARVEKWQFAATALPFWLILTLIPVAFIALITARNTRL